MGAPTAQVQSSTQPQGKGAPAPAVMPNEDFKPVPIGQPGDDFMPGQRPAGGYARIQDINPRGKGGTITTPVQSGQPSIGRPNTYANTVGPWDNSRIGTQIPQTFEYKAPTPVAQPSNSGKFASQPAPNDIGAVFGRVMAERLGSRMGKGA